MEGQRRTALVWWGLRCRNGTRGDGRMVRLQAMHVQALKQSIEEKEDGSERRRSCLVTSTRAAASGRLVTFTAALGRLFIRRRAGASGPS